MGKEPSFGWRILIWYGLGCFVGQLILKAILGYTVQPSQVSAITLIELLDAYNNVLTSDPVYVPVATTESFTHTIPVEEGT